MKKRLLIFSGLMILLLLVSGCSKNSETASLNLETGSRYELYIGLHDATTGKQIIDTDEATRIIKTKILDRVSGVTITVSNGSYYVGALIVDETSLNCVIYGADDESISQLVEELNEELNLTVLVSKTSVDYNLFAPTTDLPLSKV